MGGNEFNLSIVCMVLCASWLINFEKFKTGSKHLKPEVRIKLQHVHTYYVLHCQLTVVKCKNPHLMRLPVFAASNFVRV